jgi:two-component system chemotaxis response regulator CheY
MLVGLRYTPSEFPYAMYTILIVDDSPTIRRMVRASLGTVAGTTIVESVSGLQAIEALAIAPVHAIVLDLNMPDMHGLDVLRFVRSHERYRTVPVLVLTTRGDSTSREAVMQAGATSYMTKPFMPADLAAAVSDLLAAVPGKG